MIDTNRFKWINEPDKYEITEDRISITTKPHTDLWQRTYYHFRNDNAPCLQIETDEKFFSFVVRTDFSESHHRFDQCGVVLYMDSDNWLKGSVEYENENCYTNYKLEASGKSFRIVGNIHKDVSVLIDKDDN